MFAVATATVVAAVVENGETKMRTNSKSYLKRADSRKINVLLV